MRFLNHGSYGLDNALPICRYVNGFVRIGFYAKTSIRVGDEIFFDYGENYKLPWIIKFNEQRKLEVLQQRNINKNIKKNIKQEIDLFEDDLIEINSSYTDSIIEFE